MNKHKNILETILPIPDGYKLVAIKNNEMTLVKMEKKNGKNNN